MANLASAALVLAQRGLAVFPCKHRDKIPITKHGCLDASTDPEQVIAWWQQYPLANIGIATGKPFGIFVIDVDEDGETGIREIEKKYGTSIPATVEAITGSGGRHLYFRLPDFADAPVIKNSAKQIGTGLDVRGEGGYVVAPPSLHPSGRAYTWSVDIAREFADPPVWLVAHITLPPHIDSTAELTRQSGDHWAEIAKGVGEGCRNHTAASFAGYLLRRGVDAQATLQLMLSWNRDRNRPPLPDQKIVSTVESIAKRELSRLQGFKENGSR